MSIMWFDEIGRLLCFSFGCCEGKSACHAVAATTIKGVVRIVSMGGGAKGRFRFPVGVEAKIFVL